MDWEQEHRRFMAAAYPATLKPQSEHSGLGLGTNETMRSRSAWLRCGINGAGWSQNHKSPEKMLGSLINFAILWSSTTARSPAEPERPTCLTMVRLRAAAILDRRRRPPNIRLIVEKSWINWHVQTGDSPLELAAALEQSAI